MNRFKLFLLFAIIGLQINLAKAQFFEGTPLGFSSLVGERYNPGDHPINSNNHSNMWVVTMTDVYSESELALMTCEFAEMHPEHAILGNTTYTYNCHGFSHSVFQGGERCQIFWYEELCWDAFEQTTTPQKDDIAVIRTNAYQNEFDAGSIHSSVVVNEDTLISKWGDGPLTKHHKNDVIGFSNLGTTLQAFLQSGKLTDANDLNYIYDKAKKL